MDIWRFLGWGISIQMEILGMGNLQTNGDSWDGDSLGNIQTYGESPNRSPNNETTLPLSLLGGTPRQTSVKRLLGLVSRDGRDHSLPSW